jgi:hypothetical protein
METDAHTQTAFVLKNERPFSCLYRLYRKKNRAELYDDYLHEADVLGVDAEALTAGVDAVLAESQ